MINIPLNHLNVIEKTPSNFGNGAHVLVSKELIGKKAKVIFGESKISKIKLTIDLFDCEILERKVARFGTGAHILVPKEYSGKKLNILIEVKNE
jgi:putative transposon-encoded protein